jgi:hypothetical protein
MTWQLELQKLVFWGVAAYLPVPKRLIHPALFLRP